MNEEDRTTAKGLARYARDFYDAAIAADHVIGRRPGYEISAPMPVMFLVAQSIELVLKAYLRHQGFSLDEMRKQGHDLVGCWQSAIDRGAEDHVQLTPTDLHVLELISDLHVSTELRYIRTGSKTLPVFGPLQNLTTKLLDAICPIVGYHQR